VTPRSIHQVHHHDSSTYHRPVHADRRHLQYIIAQTELCLLNSTIIEEEETSYVLLSLIMCYMLSLMICCIVMILLDNMLQCLISIVMINLSSTCDYIVVWICNSLVMFMSYFSIKLKLKMLLFPARSL
jgi:hypothetical protein